MKVLFASLVVACAPALGLAQAQPAAKPAAQSASKPAAKPVAKPTAKARPARSARKSVEKKTEPADEYAHIQLSPVALEVARKVYVGVMRCELGAKVTVTPLERPGFFLMALKNHRFHMHPVESRTGAIRLEDTRGGAVWIQLGNKSMLMSEKLGQRLADECQSPEQVTQAEFLKLNPLPNLLEGLMPRTGAAGVASPAAPAAPAGP